MKIRSYSGMYLIVTDSEHYKHTWSSGESQWRKYWYWHRSQWKNEKIELLKSMLIHKKGWENAKFGYCENSRL